MSKAAEKKLQNHLEKGAEQIDQGVRRAVGLQKQVPETKSLPKPSSERFEIEF